MSLSGEGPLNDTLFYQRRFQAAATITRYHRNVAVNGITKFLHRLTDMFWHPVSHNVACKPTFFLLTYVTFR